MAIAKDGKEKALEAQVLQIKKQYGEGAIMKLGDDSIKMNVESISTGSLSLNIRRHGPLRREPGPPQGPLRRPRRRPHHRGAAPGPGGRRGGAGRPAAGPVAHAARGPAHPRRAAGPPVLDHQRRQGRRVRPLARARPAVHAPAGGAGLRHHHRQPGPAGRRPGLRDRLPPHAAPGVAA